MRFSCFQDFWANTQVPRHRLCRLEEGAGFFLKGLSYMSPLPIYSEPKNLASSDLMSQLHFITEGEILGNLSGGPWVLGKQGQPYFHVCIHLHEDEPLSGSIPNATGQPVS